MADNYGTVLAKNVRAARARKGLDQEPLAVRMRALGYSAWRRQTVASVEKANRRLTAEEILGLALALQTTIGALMEPAADDEFVSLPSGQLVRGNTVSVSLRFGYDSTIMWDGNVPRFGLPSIPGEDDSR